VAEWVPVIKGTAAGTQIEVQGALKAGDWVVERGSDELREGTRVAARHAAPAKSS
jgi:hypothetical protein